MQIDMAVTDKMVEKAISECAEEQFAGDNRRMRQALLRGQCEHCRCIIAHLTSQIGEYLGQVDNTIKAVYQYEPMEPSSSDQHAGKSRTMARSGINIVVWVNRKSAALTALIEMMEIGFSVQLAPAGMRAGFAGLCNSGCNHGR